MLFYVMVNKRHITKPSKYSDEYKNRLMLKEPTFIYNPQTRQWKIVYQKPNYKLKNIPDLIDPNGRNKLKTSTKRRLFSKKGEE